MTPLDTLIFAGLIVSADGDRLLVHPRHLLTDHLRVLIRDNKPHILASLSDAAKPFSETEPQEPDRPAPITEPPGPNPEIPMVPVLWTDGRTRYMQDWDERRTCLQCRNLSEDGRCLAAWRGELLGVMPDFEPIKDMLQRCAGYAPGPDDIDQREGRFAAYCISKMYRAAYSG